VVRSRLDFRRAPTASPGREEAAWTATRPAVPEHIDATPGHGGVRDPEPIAVVAVDGTAWEPVWDQLMCSHHYRATVFRARGYRLLAARPKTCWPQAAMAVTSRGTRGPSTPTPGPLGRHCLP